MRIEDIEIPYYYSYYDSVFVGDFMITLKIEDMNKHKDTPQASTDEACGVNNTNEYKPIIKNKC